MTISDDLRQAATVLRRDGWQQHDVGTVDGPKCALGALQYVASGGTGVRGDDIDASAYARAHKADVAVSKFVGKWVAAWNDNPDRTAEEVITTLETVAKENEDG